MIHASLDSFLTLAQSGKAFYCCKAPNTANVTFFELDNQACNIPQHVENTYIATCDFNASKPKLYRSRNTFKLPLNELNGLSKLPTLLPDTFEEGTNTDKQEYIAGVEKAKKLISNGPLHKVVLSQTHHVVCNTSTIFDFFIELCTNASAYCYVLHLPHEHTWIGASPELFIRSQNKEFETMALAGTRLKGSNSTWGQKEINEQQIVGDFICEELHNLAFSSITRHDNFTKQTGNIEHICSPVTATLPNSVNWERIIQRLHPTPALAGYPKQDAMAFIADTESFERELFGGFIGLISPNLVELYVNIRCAKLGQGNAQLFAGAGLNIDSIPSEEWEETLNKLAVTKDVLTKVRN